MFIFSFILYCISFIYTQIVQELLHFRKTKQNSTYILKVNRLIYNPSMFVVIIKGTMQNPACTGLRFSKSSNKFRKQKILNYPKNQFFFVECSILQGNSVYLFEGTFKSLYSTSHLGQILIPKFIFFFLSQVRIKSARNH